MPTTIQPSLPSYTGSTRPNDPADTQRVGPAAGVTAAPSDLGAPQSLQDAQATLFRPSGQLPIADPPAAADDAAANSLATKFQTLLDQSRDTSAGNAALAAAGPLNAQNAPPATPSLSPLFAITDLLELMVRLGATQFKQAMQEAQEDVTQKIEQLSDSANQIQAAAKQRLAGAIASGAGGIVAGTLGVASAGVNFGGSVSANNKIAAMGLQPNERAGMFNTMTSKTSAVAASFQGGGQGIQGGMGIVQGTDEQSAATDDKAKAQAEKAAAALDAGHDTALSMKQQYQGVLQDYLDKLKQFMQSQNDAMMSVVRNV
jgi:hypothetical protein